MTKLTKLRRKCDVPRKKTFRYFLQLRENVFVVFRLFLQNHQGSLVSKNSKKQTLVMQSDKRQKIVKKMWCSKKMLIFSVFVAPKWCSFRVFCIFFWSLVIQFDGIEKIEEKMWCSKKKWNFSLFHAIERSSFAEFPKFFQKLSR